MKPHPSEHQLRQWLDGSLDEAESRMIEAHIESCPDVCQRRLDKLPAGAVARTRELRLTWSGRLAQPGDTPDVSAAPPTPTSATSPESPAVPRGYEFVAVLGRGGMGSVVRARELALARDIAIKFVEPRFGSADPRFFTRFALEAEAMARLRHPNIVPVYTVGDAGGRPFLAMELAEGGSLSDRLKSTGPLDARQAAAICELLARAAHHAHERGVIHRDLKPSNILLAAAPEPPTQGAIPPAAARIAGDICVPKVSDFGLVKLEDAASPSASADMPTLAGEVWGSPGFMSPEQARGDVSAVGVRTDVHALGAILYFLLVGRSPFDAATAAQVIERVKQQTPEPPRKLRRDIPADLETICLKALQKSPADRYASAADLADDLRRFQGGRPIAARPFGPAERAWRWAKRNKALASALAGFVLALVVGTVVSLAYAVKADRNATDANRNFDAAVRERAAADIARTRAETATDLAHRNAEEIRRRSVELATQLELAEWHAYDTEIALAREDLRNGESANARDRLSRGRWDLRSWEHDHLAGMLDGRHGVRRMPLPPLIRSRAAFLAADGRSVFAIEDARRVVGGKIATAVVIRDATTGEHRRELATQGHAATLLAQAAGRVFAADANGQILGWNTDTGDVTLSLAMFQHLGGATSISCGDDGTRLLTVASAGAMRLWNAESGALVTTFESSDNAKCLAGAISGDGTHVAGLFADRTIRLWRSDGTAVGSISVRHGTPRVVALDRRATRVAAGDTGGGVAVWSVAGRELLGYRAAHQGAVSGVRYSADGARLASGGKDGTVRLWPRDLDAPAIVLHAHGGEVVGLDFSGDDVTLMTSGGNWLGQHDVRLWNVDAAVARNQPLPVHNARANGFIQAEKSLLSLQPDGTVELRDVDSRQVTASARFVPSVPPDAPVAISPDGRHIAIGRGGAIELIDTLDQRVATRLPEAAGRVTAIHYRGANRLLALYERGAAIVWEIAPTPIARVRVDGVMSAVLSGDGRWLATAIADAAKIDVRSVDNPAAVHALPVDPSKVVPLSISRDGGLLIAAVSPYLHVFDRTPDGYRQRLRAFQGYGMMMSMDLHPDGTRLVTGGMDMHSLRGRVELINLHNGAVSRTRYVYPNNVRDVRFSPDGTRLLVSYNSGAELYDDGGLLRRRSIRALGGGFSRVAFAADRRILTLTDPWPSASGPATPDLVNIDGHSGRGNFDPATRQYRLADLTSLTPEQRGFRCLDVTPDGRHAVLGAAAGALVVYDVPGYRADRVIAASDTGIVAVGCAPDGRHVATMDEARTTSVIELATGRRVWSRTADTAATRPLTNLATNFATKPTAAPPRRTDIAWRADAAALAIIDGVNVVVLSGTTGAPLRPPLRHDAEVRSISFDPATACLAVGCADGAIVLWPPDEGPPRIAKVHPHAVASLRFHPAGGLLLSADVTRRVMVVDGATLDVVHQVNDGDAAPALDAPAVAWSRDGATFAASVGQEMLVWTLPQPPTTRPTTRPAP